MIQIDGIPRSMYGMYGREQPLVSFGSVSYSGINASSPSGPPAVRSGMVAGPSKIEEDGVGPTTAALPAVGWGERLRNRREYTMLKKVVQLLQDNRVQTGDAETAQRLQELNRTQTESFPILKIILNGLFVTTGVILLVGVVAVIIYTSLVKPGSPNDILRNYINLNPEDENSDFDESAVTSGSSALSIDDPLFSSNEDGDGDGDGDDGDDNNAGYLDNYNTDSEELTQSMEPPIGQPVKEDGGEGLTLSPTAKTPRRVGLSRTKQTVTKCRIVPVVHSDNTVVKIGEICFQVPASIDPSTGS